MEPLFTWSRTDPSSEEKRGSFDDLWEEMSQVLRGEFLYSDVELAQERGMVYQITHYRLPLGEDLIRGDFVIRRIH